MRFLGKLWPDVVARRTWDGDGRPAWEFRITSRRADRVSHEPMPVADAASHLTHAGVVTSRGVQIGADTLRIDEFHYLLSQPDIDFSQLLDGPDIAVALLELAADPSSEILRDRVAGRLAVIRGWFQNAPTLDVTAARIAGSGIGRLLDGVFIWRAHDSHETLTYIVTPSVQARDLLKADPRLARALIQVACPRPDDPQGELERRLTEAIGRLNAAAEPGLEPGAPAAVNGAGARSGTGAPVNAGAVLEIRSGQAQVSVSAANTGATAGVAEAAEAAQAPDGTSSEEPAFERNGFEHGGFERSEVDRALSEELAELARKVGTAAVRATPSPRSATIDLDASARRSFAEPFLQAGRPSGGTPERSEQ